MTADMAGMDTLDKIKRDAVKARCELLGSDRKVVAASLGVSVKTLYNMLHKWDLMPAVVRRPHKKKAHSLDCMNARKAAATHGGQMASCVEGCPVR